MTDITFERVVQLADQLNPEEQAALVAHLLKNVRQQKLTAQQKKELLRSITIPTDPIPEAAFHRAGWYDDEQL